MSLEATHIRFALALMDEYKIEDINKYIAGAIYPDSRYITGIKREATHHDRFLSPDFADDDFKRGWQAHKICDHVSYIVMKRLFPEIFPNDDYDKQTWINSTAIKIIQDIDDVQLFDIQKYLECLEYAHNPNDEDIKEIKRYNNIMVDLYKGKKYIVVEDSIAMWIALGQDEEVCEQVRIKTKIFLNDSEMLKRIKSIYDEIINSYKEIIETTIKG